jgi:hypothetical protein
MKVWLDDSGVLSVETPEGEWQIGEFHLDEDDKLYLELNPDIDDEYVATDEDGCIAVFQA